MSTIRIHFQDQLYCKVQADNEVIEGLADDLSFYVPGYKFTPKFKAGQWDGRIKLLDKRSGRVYKNLIPKILRWADQNEHSVELVDREKFKPKVKWDKSWLDNWAKYGKMKPHQHQLDYVDAIMRQNQGLILSPTSSGKSYVIYLCIRYYLENCDGDILITVPTTSLVEQLYSDFESYAVDWDVSEHVQMLYGGKDKTDKKRVLISTWQSCFNNPPEFFQRFDAYFCDEAHGADAKSLSGIIDKLKHASMRVGLTGTLDGTVVHELDLVGRFGFVIKKITTRELMDMGLVSKLSIICHRIKYPYEESNAVIKAKAYDKEVDYIVKHEKRNDFVSEIALKAAGNTLVLFNFIEKQGKPLKEKLEKLASENGKTVLYIAGSVKTLERETIRNIMETRNDVVLLASFGTLSTGVNIKNIENIVFAHPYKARIKSLQSIGRGLRVKEGKEGVTLHDICDDFSVVRGRKEKVNFLLNHFVERLKTYRSEEFDYEIRKIEFSEDLL